MSGCTLPYKDQIASNAIFGVQSTTEEGLTIDPLSLKVTFTDQLQELVFLENYNK